MLSLLHSAVSLLHSAVSKGNATCNLKVQWQGNGRASHAIGPPFSLDEPQDMSCTAHSPLQQMLVLGGGQLSVANFATVV